MLSYYTLNRQSKLNRENWKYQPKAILVVTITPSNSQFDGTIKLLNIAECTNHS